MRRTIALTEISFDKRKVSLFGIVTIRLTKTAVGQISDANISVPEIAKNLSSCSRLVIAPGYDSTNFTIHSPWGVFFCVRSEDKDYTVSALSYKEKDIMSHNKALKYGIPFEATNGVKVIYWDEAGIVNVYTDGILGAEKNQDEVYQKSSIDTIFAEVSKYIAKRGKQKNDTQYSDVEEVEQEVPSFGDLALGEILGMSEQYSILASEIEYQTIQEQGRFIYTNFQASEYLRTDRIAYDFVVRDIDLNIIKEGVQVSITDIAEKSYTGEIAQISVLDESDSIITILFNRLIDFNTLKRSGWITLSFSTVNRDVQLKANQNIRNGLSKAKYFKAVLGENSPQGFDDKDLSETMDRLKRQKYVPNDSQLKAIERGINAKDIFLVMGPPGTGKTTVILEWVKYFVFKENKRVLISSQNNKAVDNVLARLADEKDIEIIRIGSELKIQNDVVQNMFENKVVQLRKELKVSSDRSLDTINSQIADYEKLFEKLNRLKGLFRVFELTLKVEKDLIRETISSDVNELRELEQQYKETKSYYEKQRIDILDYKRIVNAYNSSDALGKMKLKKKYKDAKEKLENAGECSSLLEKVNLIAIQYNLKRAELNESIEDQKDRLLGKIKQLARNINKERTSVIEHITPDEKSFIASITNIDLEIENANDEDSINNIVGIIESKLENLRQYLSCLAQWKEGVVDNQNYSTDSIILDSVNVVGATCIGVSSQSRFADLDFDITIIDEAGQIQIHNALVPMSVSSKVIMLGDYKQIPPSAEQELIESCEENGIPTEYLKKSLFEVLYNNIPDTNKIMLDTQYRMPGEIADIISEWFYNGEYKSFDGKRNMESIIPELSKSPFIIVDTSDCNNRFEERTDEGGTYNILEASLCSDLVRYAIEKNKCDLEEIGVISAYKAQVGRIKQDLKKKIPNMETGEIVATLDSFQGQERDLILYSFTKSSMKKAKKNRIGFLNELRRLNVAMSRCKKTLVLIGDIEFLSSCEHQDKDEDGNWIYEQSEKEFSDFIKFMVNSVKEGKGELISYSNYIERIK